jgi:hypothetical protein
MSQILQKACNCALKIVKLVIPFSLFCDLLQYFGIIENIAFLFNPISQILLLPNGAGLALASGFFFNLYAGIAVAATLDLTPFQWTIFGTFLAMCHSIPLEGAVLKKVGMPITWHCATRFLCGFSSAWLVSRLMNNPAYFQAAIPKGDVNIVRHTNESVILQISNSISNACFLTIKIVVLVSSLIIFFELIKKIPFITKFLNSHAYASSLIVGILLGVTYGAGILLKDIQNVSKQQRMLLLVFLMLAHGLIEETLLFTYFGAIPMPVLSFRLGFALLGLALTYLFFKRVILISKLRCWILQVRGN